jgi:hypothetical protein
MTGLLTHSHLPVLRAVVDEVGAMALSALARRPGVIGVYRVTTRTHDGRARDTVATLLFLREAARLEVVYRAAFDHKPIVYTIPQPRAEAFVRALNAVGFDRLTDQPDIPPYGVDVWLIERAAGTFAHGVLVTPGRGEGAHTALVAGVHTCLPEALREMA